MEGTHEGIGDTSDALESGDHDEAMKQMEALKEHMAETHENMKEDVEAHQEAADQVIVSRAKYEESLGLDGMGNTMEGLGSTKEEAMKAFDECDKKDATPGDGKLLEKDFLACELHRVEKETKKEFKKASHAKNATNGTNGTNLTNATGQGDPYCFWRISNLISGHLYMDSRKINRDLRRENTQLHHKLRHAYDVFAEAEANLTAQLLASGNITTEDAVARANHTWHSRHLPVIDKAHENVVHFVDLPKEEQKSPFVAFGRSEKPNPHGVVLTAETPHFRGQKLSTSAAAATGTLKKMKKGTGSSRKKPRTINSKAV